MKRAVVLLSGGLDSATTLAICLREKFDTFPLSFDYGQRHRIELNAARAVAHSLGAREPEIAIIDLRVFGGSALTDSTLDVPRHPE
ncbi:MAG: 7-cyano-7-deazaguanine synthase, partial [Verrucomicrobiota bacterium]|nr:7-cyano-7-deazaguanine synthase [Verrucomicrobiota bacterium]